MVKWLVQYLLNCKKMVKADSTMSKIMSSLLNLSYKDLHNWDYSVPYFSLKSHLCLLLSLPILYSPITVHFSKILSWTIPYLVAESSHNSAFFWNISPSNLHLNNLHLYFCFPISPPSGSLLWVSETKFSVSAMPFLNIPWFLCWSTNPSLAYFLVYCLHKLQT